MNPEQFAGHVERIESEIAKVIVGQADLIETVLLAALCEGHVLLEGVPGLGKTRLLQVLGQVLDMEFGRVQFTPDLMPADILGTMVLRQGAFEFHKGPVFTNLLLADEINRATPKTQSAMLEAMQERRVTLGGETRDLPRPFLVMATQNPIEMEGTYPLPEAQLDRFLFKALVEFPGNDDLTEIVRRTTVFEEARPERAVDGPTLMDMGRMVRELPAATHLLRYAAVLTEATHPESDIAPPGVRKYVRFGASPRGAQALVLGGKAHALMNGRENLAAADIRAVAGGALRHRVVFGYEAVADGIRPDELVAEVLDAHPEPEA